VLRHRASDVRAAAIEVLAGVAGRSQDVSAVRRIARALWWHVTDEDVLQRLAAFERVVGRVAALRAVAPASLAARPL
jgi:hypothetical protein